MSRSAERRLDGVRLAFDHARPGDERPALRRRCVTPPTATFDVGRTRLPYHGRRRRLPRARACGDGSRRRIRRTAGAACSGFDLNSGWNCTATCHGCVGQLDDLDELAVERAADDLEALVRQRLLVEAVELVAVAVALVDDVGAVERVRLRARLQLCRRTIRAASSRPGRRRRAGRAACRSRFVVVSGAHSVESASARPQTCRAYSTAAHWKP